MFLKGDPVIIKTEWQDPGDDQFNWEVIEDECRARVTICPVDSPLAIKPYYRVNTDMLIDPAEYRGADYGND